QGLAMAWGVCHIPRLSGRPSRRGCGWGPGSTDEPSRAAPSNRIESRGRRSMSWQAGLYVAAVLIPLAAFAIEVLFIRFLGKMNAYVATAAIGLSFVLSLIGFIDYPIESGGFSKPHHEASAGAEPAHAAARPATDERNAQAEEAHQPVVWKASVN